MFNSLYLSLFLWEHFPRLALLFSECGKFWERAAALGGKPVTMEFASLFFCMAINIDLGEAVKSWPHRDMMNLSIGLCVIYVFGKFSIYRTRPPNNFRLGFFDDEETAWLVNLEAGVIIQLPSGAFYAFPSALLTHWNANKKGKVLPFSLFGFQLSPP
jgi:hypothetical protein